MAKYCPEKDGPALYADCQECEKHICEYFFCLVVGSRGFRDYSLLKERLDYYLQNQGDEAVIVSGGANGADSLAEQYAKERGLPLKVFHADWQTHGKGAGYIRNKQMHKYLSKQSKRGVVAFWDGKSKGTTHSFDLAKEYGNPLKIVRERETK